MEQSHWVRAADEHDIAAIGKVAAEVDQDHEWAGGDPRYVRHLQAAGRFVVAEDRSGVVGYAATRTLHHRRVGCVAMLADLFVVPAARARGLGQAMLSELWADQPRRMTFSSQHASALPLYARFGLAAGWPLLYLTGRPDPLPAADLHVDEVAPGEAAALEREWTGWDRSTDYAAWAGRPGARVFLVRRDARQLAVGAGGGPDGAVAVEHLRLAPDTTVEDVRAVVCAALRSMPGDRVTAHLPGPHPAVGPLLAAGWRVTDFDLFMATSPALLDPARDVPSPGLA